MICDGLRWSPMISDDFHARVQCKITRVLQCKLKMDPPGAGSDPNSARLGRIRPCFSPLGGASDPCWADLGVHPTCFRSIWGCIRPVLGRSDPMKLSNIPLVFQSFLKTGPTRDGSNPDLTRPGLIQPVLGRFGGASDLFSVDLGVQTARMDPIRPDDFNLF